METPKRVHLQTVKTHIAVFHQGLHGLLNLNRSSEKEIQCFLEIIACGPSIYRVDHPGLTVPNPVENSIGLKRGKSYRVRQTNHNNTLHYWIA